MRLRLSIEFSVGILAALTLLLLAPPLNMPIFALYVFWGAAFLLGAPNFEGLKKMVPPILIGSLFALGTLYVFGWVDPLVSGGTTVVLLVNMVILFVIATLLTYTARIPGFGTVAATFLGFAMVFANAFAKLGLAQNLIAYWFSAALMCIVGILFAWACVALTRPNLAPAREKALEAEASKSS